MAVAEFGRTKKKLGGNFEKLWEKRRLLGAVILSLGAAVAFFGAPAWSAFDSVYSLVWGQDLIAGRLPSFEAYRAPTQHPAWVLLSTVLAPFGDTGNRAMVGVCVASFVALVIGVFRLARAAVNEPVAWLAALIMLTRLDFGFLAIRAYVDIPFLALVIWAAVLETEHPRRSKLIWPLLITAGLLRPEAWMIGGVYAIYVGWRSRWATRARQCVLAAVAPAVWLLSDMVVTGDPLYSMNYTTRSALELNRRAPIEQLPQHLWNGLLTLTKPPVFFAGLVGIFLAIRLLTPRWRLRPPLFLFLFGIFNFLLISVRGFAVIDRYLVISATMLTIFAATTIGGWTLLPQTTHLAVLVRRGWIAAAAIAVIGGAAWTAAHFNPGYVRWQLSVRKEVQRDLATVLADTRVVAARKCGPVTVPNHKLVPDVRYMTAAKENQVLARSALADHGQRIGGVALYLVGDKKFLNHPAYAPFDQLRDAPEIQVPGPSFHQVKVTPHFVAYVNCPPAS